MEVLGGQVWRTIQAHDRPDVIFKIEVLKGRTSLVATTVVPIGNVTGIAVMDPVDMEKEKTLDLRRNNFSGKDMSMHDTTSLHNAELCIFRSLWIPFKNTKYLCDSDNAFKCNDYIVEVFATADENTGTLIADDIGSTLKL